MVAFISHHFLEITQKLFVLLNSEYVMPWKAFNYAVEYAIGMLSFLDGNARAMDYIAKLKANYAQFTYDETSYDEVLAFGDVPGEIAKLLIVAFDRSQQLVNSSTYNDYALWALIANNYLVAQLQNSIVCVLGMRRFRQTNLSVLPKDVAKLIAYEMWDTRKDCAPKCWAK